MAGQLSLGVERVLPDLGRNIKCGNSLIGPEFYEGKLDLPDDETVGRVNAFDWKKEFPEVMTAGGFDAVIGNPPYVLHPGRGCAPMEVEHYRKSTRVLQSATYHLFVEQGARARALGGYCSLITPSNFLK
ncbi:Eco57I restriction-modification methylase domain-containing protein [Candidatus Amarolinea dominans]|uniref:Eco57I restriction-modification methylase domain-containing protein n=1 Tax=Candidatus Amarolinea dominans TaxID=3140696 RepID=UPI0031CCA7D5